MCKVKIRPLNPPRLAVARHFGIYKLRARSQTFGTTPAVAAGLEERPWSLERVVEMTRAYVRRKEDEFEEAFAEVGL